MKSQFDIYWDMYMKGNIKTGGTMNYKIKNQKRFLFLFFTFSLFTFLYAQNTLEEIVTWEIPGEVIFRCVNLNSDGSDLNNDGYDDFIHWYPGDPYRFQFFYGKLYTKYNL